MQLSKMKMKTKNNEEKRFHITRKIDVSPSFNFVVRLGVILFAFLFITVLFTGVSGLGFSQTVSTMFYGAFGTTTFIDQTTLNMMQLLILAIGLVPAFKMKYWNTGALGQALIGNLCSSIIVFYLGPVIPNTFLLLLLAFLFALVGGAIWGGIPGYFKAKLKANETLFTLMMNYIAIQLVAIFIEIFKGGDKDLKPFQYGAFNKLFGLTYGWPILIVVIAAIFIFVYMRFSKHGYELSVLGESYNTAKYAGINTNVVILRTAILSGAICAICGFMFTASNNSLSSTSDGGYGFTSIIVAWSSHFSILGMFIISFIIAFLKKGTDGIANKAGNKMNEYSAYISIGIFLLLFIGIEFFLNYKFVPSSKYAQIQEEKRKELQEKHPAYYRNKEIITYRTKQFFAKSDAFLANSKLYMANKMNNLIGWFKSIFSKKEKEANK